MFQADENGRRSTRHDIIHHYLLYDVDVDYLRINNNTMKDKHEHYGVYITHNTYTNKWHAFDRSDAHKYWNGESCKQGIGDTHKQALADYKKKTSSYLIDIV